MSLKEMEENEELQKPILANEALDKSIKASELHLKDAYNKIREACAKGATEVYVLEDAGDDILLPDGVVEELKRRQFKATKEGHIQWGTIVHPSE
jgi:hypothetical protein